MVAVKYDALARKTWETMSAAAFPGWSIDVATAAVDKEVLDEASEGARPEIKARSRLPSHLLNYPSAFPCSGQPLRTCSQGRW